MCERREINSFVNLYAPGSGGDIGGAGGAWAPPLFIQGGQSTPKLFDHRTEQSTKIALLLLHCKKRINFQAQLIKQTRDFAFVF